MSGLEKFQATEAWRTHFKKFLFMERKPKIVQSTLPETESQRYSLDIDDDLKNIIEQKKNKKTVQINLNEEIIRIPHPTTESHLQPEVNILTAEMNDKVNANAFDDATYGEEHMRQKISDENLEDLDLNSTLFKCSNEEGEHNNVLRWHKSSDESFEALEKMCNKTGSDPNSTLFKYLHSDRKEEVLAEAKKRSADGNNLDSHNNKCEDDDLLTKINNCTLLDEVEAPSRLWENSICGDTILQTSPVKIVGLLRPSTIIEEAPDDSTNSDVSSQLSFRTTTKGIQSDISSSAYETADDFTSACPQEVKFVDVDQMLLNALAKNEQKQCTEPEIISNSDMMDTTFVERESSQSERAGNSSNIHDVSVDLIDLEKTFAPLYRSPHPSILGENRKKDVKNCENGTENKIGSSSVLDDSVIEIISDDEIDDVQNMGNKIGKEKETLQNLKPEIRLSHSSRNHDMHIFNQTDESDKENFVESDEPTEKSMQFNDTMEEVEYMLKKGLEYMAAEAAAKKSAEETKTTSECKNHVQRTQTNSHVKDMDSTKNISSPLKAKSSAKKTPACKGQSSTSKRFDIDIRPFPKLDIFAKPQQVHSRSKQQKFSHIVSPIGTYMKKTAQTPLMSSMSCKNKDYFNSTAILELENESRLYQPQFATYLNGNEAMGLPKLPGVNSGGKRPLPKKAYISSDLKHIVDSRTPVTIPGGKKIQKYLENAMMPAVLRHEGKFKIPGGAGNILKSTTASSPKAPSKLPLKVSNTNSKDTPTAKHVAQRANNASFADLSLMSGDVSMYTIRDAQKF